MAYYNDDRYDRRGGGNYGYGRDNYGRGYDDRRGGYGRDRQGFDRFDGHGRFRFDIGEKVIHTATGTELSVIGFGREQIECRKPDLSTGWFYDHELQPIDSNK